MNYQTIKVSQQNDEINVAILESRIYLGITDVFSEEMSQIVQLKFNHMTIDMAKVNVMNSSGIGVLIKTRDELQKQGKKMKLIKLQPLMTDIFNRMRLDTLFDYESE
jgi:anti-anti-sigma factor